MFEEVEVGSYFEVGGPFEMLIISPELFYGCNIGNGEEAVFEVAFSLDEVLIPEFERDFEGQMFLSLLHNI